jgi:hypothetical protein
MDHLEISRSREIIYTFSPFFISFEMNGIPQTARARALDKRVEAADFD